MYSLSVLYIFHISLAKNQKIKSFVCFLNKNARYFQLNSESVNISSSDTTSDSMTGGHITGQMLSGNPNQEQITLQFLDEEAGGDLKVTSSTERSFYSDYMSSTELGEFLSRPLRIQSVSWSVGGNLNTTFEPWDLFFNSTAVTHKLQNYPFLSCDLHLKYVINAAPFYYGAAMATYCPLTSFNADSIDTNLSATSDARYSALSTRPKVWLYPQTCQGGEMTLPFFYHKNWLSVTTRSDFQNMGTVSLVSIGNLSDASASAGSAVTISVFAWASNVRLTGATIGAALQSSDFTYSEPSISSLSPCNSPTFLHELDDFTVPDYSMIGSKVHSLLAIEPFRDIDQLTYEILNHLGKLPVLKRIRVLRYLISMRKKKVLSKNNCVLQSRSEYYGNGIISKPASAVAKVIERLKNVPIIGPYALSSSMILSGVSDLSAHFGYTNVPVIEDTKPLRPLAFGGFASPEISQPVEKLTIDPKNELTVDPRVAGIEGDDELVITNIIGRECYFLTSTWSTSTTVDTNVASVAVTPHIGNYFTDTNSIIHWQGTPLSHIGAMFGYWRGDIIYRFKVVCSRFHRGRLLVQWDPVSDLTVSTNNTNTVFSKVVDLVAETDFEVRIPYMQNTEYLQNQGFNNGNINSKYFGATNSSSWPSAYVAAVSNGYLSLKVLTVLTAPVASADVTILCFMRAADNFEFAAPQQLSNKFTLFQPQSGDVSYESPPVLWMGERLNPQDPNSHLVYMGEKITSLRQLLRRTNKTWEKTVTTNTSAQILRDYTVHAYNPLFPGFDSNGIHSFKGVVTTGSNFPANAVNQTYYTWLAYCFRGYRGSHIWHYNLNCPITNGSIKAARNSTSYLSLTAGNYYASSTVAAAADKSAVSYNEYAFGNTGHMGMSLSNQNTQAGISVLYPMYSQFRFKTTDPNTATLGTSKDASNQETGLFVVEMSPVTGTTIPAGTTIEFYHSIGTDFNFLFFLNVPTFIIYSLATAN